MTDFSVTQYNPYNMYQNFGYNPAFRGATVPQNNYNSVPQMTQQPDTVSFSVNKQIQNEKQGLSNGAKLGIGAGIVLGLGALAYVLLGLAGLALTGSYLYNVGGNLYGQVPQAIATLFSYPDLTHAGIVPYLNIAVGLKVLVGLSAVVIAFSQFKKLAEEEE